MSNDRRRILVLRGNGHWDKKSCGEFETEIDSLGFQTKAQEYAHWPKEGTLEWRESPSEISFTHELGQIYSDIRENGQFYGVVSKSVGAVATALAIDLGILKPQKLVIMGIPFNKWKHSTNINERLSNLFHSIDMPIGTKFIQQSKDKFGRFSKLEGLLRDVSVDKGYELNEISGNDHSYNMKEIMPLITNYLLK